MNRFHITAIVALALAAGASAGQAGGQTPADGLSGQASWSAPTPADVKAALDGWLETQKPPDDVRARIETLWAAPDAPAEADLLDRLAASIALADAEANRLAVYCREEAAPAPLPTFALLDDEKTPPFVRHNLRLYFGRCLARRAYYNDALTVLEPLSVRDVADPASLLFYRSVVHYRLLQKKQCLESAARLLENERAVPRRFAAVARLMQADIEPLKADSLDEVARLMDSIRVRLDQGRAGTRVRKEEDDVIAKLDKMIEELEKQRQQQQGGMGGMNPSQPMPDSTPGGGTGPGDVAPKKLARGGDWGDLPPKQRQEALQQISKEFPSHYREAIEEYFRKLARDGVNE